MTHGNESGQDGAQDNGGLFVIAIPLGLLAGVVVGAFLDNVGLGLAVGLSAGAAVSAIGSARSTPGSADDT